RVLAYLPPVSNPIQHFIQIFCRDWSLIVGIVLVHEVTNFFEPLNRQPRIPAHGFLYSFDTLVNGNPPVLLTKEENDWCADLTPYRHGIEVHLLIPLC